MAVIFGREADPNLRRFAAIVAEMAASDEPSSKCIAWNLTWDNRVSPERALEFYRSSGFPNSVEDLQQALVDYVELSASRDPGTTYFCPANQQNFVSDRIPQSLELGHVLNVSSVLHRLQTEPRAREWDLDLAILLQAEDTLRRATGTAEREHIIDELLRAEFLLRGNRPFWAAAWSSLERNIEHASPNTWHTSVGLWRSRATFQILVRYPAAIAGQLVRPTQLDVGWFEYHFPSPQHLACGKGGFAMALRELFLPRPQLISEFIHRPVQLNHRHWLAADALNGRVDGSILSYVSTKLFRSQHVDRMTDAFPSHCERWLGKHNTCVIE